MREAFCARWDGYRWIAETNDAENQNYGHVTVPWPANVPVPTPPRFGPGARIRFKWDRGYLQGTIESVWKYFNIGDVHYEVREIGHRRTVYDNGRADIALVRET